jgi:hypothetical protein
MSRNANTTRFVSSGVEEVLKPPKTGMRDYILVQNVSANDIYINTDTHADVLNGIVIGAGLFWERDKNAPQNYVYLKGSVAGLQQVNIIEGIA